MVGLNRGRTNQKRTRAHWTIELSIKLRSHGERRRRSHHEDDSTARGTEQDRHGSALRDNDPYRARDCGMR